MPNPQDANNQLELGGSSQGEDGYSAWQEQRRLNRLRLARKLSLPIGREVEIELRGGIVLKGKLRLKDEELFFLDDDLSRLPLEVSGVVFTRPEVSRCVSLD